MNRFGMKLKAIRESHGKTTRDIAEKIFMSLETISHYENGRGSAKFPTMRTILRLAEGIGATPGETMELIAAAMQDIEEDNNGRY